MQSCLPEGGKKSFLKASKNEQLFDSQKKVSEKNYCRVLRPEGLKWSDK